MKRIFVGMIFGIVMSTAVLLSVAVFAQDGIAAFVRPLAVDVRQVIPILADVVVPLEDGTTVTATVPLTINVALQVSLSGVVSDSVQILEKSASEVTISEPTPAPQQGGLVVQEEEFVYDDLRWVVNSAENVGQEYDNPNDFFMGVETKGAFVVVSYTIENLGNSPKQAQYGSFFEYTVTLRDGAHREFEPHNGIYESCGFIDLNPGLSESCVIVFEVPKDATGFSTVFADDEEEKEVSLGF